MTENPVTEQKRSVYARIREVLMDEIGPKVSDRMIADEFGITPQSVHAWKIEKTIPDRDNLLEFAVKHRISVDWLLTEKGSKQLPDESQAFADLIPVDPLSDYDRLGCDFFRQLPQDDKPRFILMMRAIISELGDVNEGLPSDLREAAKILKREQNLSSNYAGVGDPLMDGPGSKEEFNRIVEDAKGQNTGELPPHKPGKLSAEELKEHLGQIEKPKLPEKKPKRKSSRKK